MIGTESHVIDSLMHAIPDAKSITMCVSGSVLVVSIKLPFWKRFLVIPARIDKRVAVAILPGILPANVLWDVDI